ncbi:hypothetical protein OHV05_15305 [Kitasatospora sp. NBC_00070]|uniref:hypothetical protein n=1 Tax=Kitasatospora sp. NBC_00070 TaxID=2975962 RepID=UPI00324C82D7
MSSARRHRTRNTTQNQACYRVTGTWPTSPRPATFAHADRRRCDRVARQFADAGALVKVEEHLGHGAWRLAYRLDGPALTAERLQAEQERLAALRQAETERRESLREQWAEHCRERELCAVEAVMVQPPIPRDGGSPRARTVAHGKGIR